MADVDIPLQDLRSAHLPSVCIFSGLAARNVYEISLSRNETATLPISDRAARSLSVYRKSLLVLVVAACATILFCALHSSQASIAIAGITTSTTIIALLVTRSKLPSSAPSSLTDHIRIIHVHPNFANALHAGSSSCSECTNKKTCSALEAEACNNSKTSAPTLTDQLDARAMRRL